MNIEETGMAARQVDASRVNYLNRCLDEPDTIVRNIDMLEVADSFDYNLGDWWALMAVCKSLHSQLEVQKTVNSGIQSKFTAQTDRLVECVKQLGGSNGYCVDGMSSFIAEVLDMDQHEVQCEWFEREYVETVVVTVRFTATPGNQDEVGWSDVQIAEAFHSDYCNIHDVDVQSRGVEEE
jgi:hypothetical protein